MASSSDCFSLANGLRVRLLHLPDSPRAAVLLRVDAGSHDEPPAFPGLAHFLEHLLFLGGEAYPGEQRLMPFVQGCGGRLNATTRAGWTEYFFEVPGERLEPGLARLLDMLVRPVFDVDRQRSEREVLEAEYLARSADIDSQCDAALTWGLAEGHPLRAFHAGRRSSLPVETVLFQEALRSFHGQHYRAPRMTLSLAGPLAGERLRALVERHAAALPPGPGRSRASAAPPLLPFRHGGMALRIASGPPRLRLGFALAGVSRRTVELLAWLLDDQAAGSLQARLGEAGVADGLRLCVPHEDAEQTLLVLEFVLAKAALESCARLEAIFFDWLVALRGHAPWADLLQAHASWRLRRRSGLAALERLREDDLTTPDEVELAQLLRQLSATRMIRLYAAPEVLGRQHEAAGFPLCIAPAGWVAGKVEPTGGWRFPAPVAASRETAPAAILLRWRGGLCRPAFFALQRALRPLAGEMRWHDDELEFLEHGAEWHLYLRGTAARLNQGLPRLFDVLRRPAPQAWAQGRRLLQAERQRLAGELPIRQLWQCLPAHLAPAREVPAESPAGLWAGLEWDALCCGLDEACLAGIPGRARLTAPAPLESPGRRADLGMRSDEAAILLFCPLPGREATDEVAWRMLGRALEGAFYRRLRSELELGYALFSGFRQVAGQGGLVFAVQSPHAEVEALLAHLEEFLAEPGWLDELALESLRQSVLDELAAPAAFFAVAERRWRARLGGRAEGWDERLRQALACFAGEDLRRAQRRLVASASARLLLTSD